MERPSFMVALDRPEAEPVEIQAVITHQDMLRGESIIKVSGSDGGNLMLTTAWCWASLVRQGDYTGSWEQFRDGACLMIDKGANVVIRPTREAAPSS